MIECHLPTLRTFTRKPTWVNRAGRVDRSACIELRASDIWRYVQFPASRHVLVPCTQRSPGAQGLRTRTARRRTGSHRSIREASTRFTISARLLAQLHDTRLPLQLAGDHRTRKSNAMKSRYIAPGKLHFAINPNRGASRCKKLGLWSTWQQEVRIERWHVHDHLTTHFLICPRCQKKYRKLFMVLTTQEEENDAEIAEGWVKMLDARLAAARHPISPELAQQRAALINRYGPLFRGRQLICKNCLGVRYGEVKWERQRQSWRKKADRYWSQRATEAAQRQAVEETRMAEWDQRLREVIPPELLEAAGRRIEEHRRKQARRALENARRQARRDAIKSQ